MNTNSVQANRLCLDFANLPFTSGDPQPHPASWLELIDFLDVERIVFGSRTEELRNLTQSDPRAAGILLAQAERLGHGLRLAFHELARGGRVESQWIEPVNEILRVTEGHDELKWDGSNWKLQFVAEHEGLEWLLAAIARSGAELIAAGPESGVQRCSNSNCQILFHDDSRTHRRRWCSMALCGNRNKVAAFARRHTSQKARAQHA
ncbi:MAG TPA: CGNR zinc finger domain-containing protein [Candidatus Acidoferrum sp.]|jgi:predicted RNA-binding Zn ribbon-like protein